MHWCIVVVHALDWHFAEKLLKSLVMPVKKFNFFVLAYFVRILISVSWEEISHSTNALVYCCSACFRSVIAIPQPSRVYYQKINVNFFVPADLKPFLLQNCLTTIYLSFLSGNTKSLEGLVGCILGFVQVPPPGGPKMTFSMGAGDRHTLSPPASETLPVTGKSVAILFNQLGRFCFVLV